MIKNKKLLSIFFCLVFVFVFVVSSFAFDFNVNDFMIPVSSFYLHDCDSTHIGVGAVSCSRVNRQGIIFSNVTTAQASSSSSSYLGYNFIYDFDSNVVAGQTYQIVFSLSRYSGSNANLSFWLYNDTSDLNNKLSNNQYIYSKQLSDISQPNPNSYSSVRFTFVYNGESHLQISLKPTSISSATNNFNVYFSDFSIAYFDENFGVESRLDDIKSGLFDNSESFNIDDVDVDSYLDSYGNQWNDLQNNANSALENRHIISGIKGYSALFSSFLDVMSETSETAWIVSLLWFSVTISVAAFLLSFVKRGKN